MLESCSSCVEYLSSGGAVERGTFRAEDMEAMKLENASGETLAGLDEGVVDVVVVEAEVVESLVEVVGGVGTLPTFIALKRPGALVRSVSMPDCIWLNAERVSGLEKAAWVAGFWIWLSSCGIMAERCCCMAGSLA